MSTPAAPSSRAVVMADVARLAGVSQQTVSRAQPEPARRPDTRERVLEAIRRLEYRPNRLARARVTHRARTLGVADIGVARRQIQAWVSRTITVRRPT